jgi:hypothetical protein
VPSQKVLFARPAYHRHMPTARAFTRSLGQDCIVAAPSLIPKKAGDRVKTNQAWVAFTAFPVW